MGIIQKTKLAGSLSIYIPCIISIMCFYSWWIGLYYYENEYILGLLITLIGIMYICALYASMSNHTLIGLCILISTLIPVILIPIVNRFKHNEMDIDDKNRGTFLCLGITPLISGICFATIGGVITYSLFTF